MVGSGLTCVLLVALPLLTWSLGAGVFGPALGGLAFAVTPFLPFALNGASYCCRR